MARPKNVTISLSPKQRAQLQKLTGEVHTEVRFESVELDRSGKIASRATLAEVAPKKGLGSIAPKKGLAEIAPKKGLGSIAPKKGLAEIAPKKGLGSIAPKKGVHIKPV